MSRLRDSVRSPGGAVGVVVVVLAFLVPLIFATSLVKGVFTQAVIFGIVAASLIFLNAYGGMVSLGQVALFGVAGFAIGNLTTNGNTKGLNLGWSPYPAIIVALAITVLLAFLLGALASRSVGIYFLMITLVYSVIANLCFGQITTISGFGGISGIPVPGFIGDADAHPARLYLLCLVVALLVYALLRYLVRTPFGLSLQGVRDDPVRMASLGYNVTLHRTLAFAFGGFIAAIGGVLFSWWNGHLDPATIDLGSTIDVLIIAVIGGLYRLEGAWLGALVFALLNNYAPKVSFLSDRFHTLIGLVFLVIILLSPGGLMGIGERFGGLRSRLRHPQTDPAAASREVSVNQGGGVGA